MSPAVHTLHSTYTNGHTYRKPQVDGFSTRAIHVGSEPNGETNAVVPAISLSTTYKQDGVGNHKGYEYSRSGNPNRDALETALASIEVGGEHAIAFSSGSAATATVLQSLGPNAHIISVNDVYGGTYRYMTRVAKENQGLETTFLDLENADDHQILAAIRPNTKLVWVESPTNPTLRLIDIARLSSLLHTLPYPQPLLLVDNTFLSPFYSSPLLLGADIVLHSLTKYINGHSDVVMGALILPPSPPSSLLSSLSPSPEPSSLSPSPEPILGPAPISKMSLVERLRFLQNAAGAVPAPYDCWLAHRGLRTLALRMKAHGLNALRVAAFLRTSPHVQEVIYPGLNSHPRHALAVESLSPHARAWVDALPASTPELAHGVPFGGMVSFRIRGGEAAALRFLESTRLFTLAESLGGVESLMEHPGRMTHASVPEARRAELGIGSELIRLSVGVEEGVDLVRDVEVALELALQGGKA